MNKEILQQVENQTIVQIIGVENYTYRVENYTYRVKYYTYYTVTK